MNSPATGGYKVIYLRSALATARVWLARAAVIGIFPLLAAALRRIDDRLKHDPIGWGNPLFTYRHLGMQAYQGIEWNIAVTFGVDVTHRFVCVQRMQLMSGNPLNAPPGSGTPP